MFQAFKKGAFISFVCDTHANKQTDPHTFTFALNNADVNGNAVHGKVAAAVVRIRTTYSPSLSFSPLSLSLTHRHVCGKTTSKPSPKRPFGLLSSVLSSPPSFAFRAPNVRTNRGVSDLLSCFSSSFRLSSLSLSPLSRSRE